MKCPILILALAAAAIPALAAGPPASRLKPVCDRVCGNWGPETVSRDSPQMFLHLAWDEASGEIRGEKISTGWEGGDGDSRVSIVYRYDAASDTIRYVETSGPNNFDSTVYVEDEGLRIIGLAPGKPALSAVTVLTFPGRGLMHEVQAESGQGYNSTSNEVDYRKEKK